MRACARVHARASHRTASPTHPPSELFQSLPPSPEAETLPPTKPGRPQDTGALTIILCQGTGSQAEGHHRGQNQSSSHLRYCQLPCGAAFYTSPPSVNLLRVVHRSHDPCCRYLAGSTVSLSLFLSLSVFFSLAVGLVTVH